MSLHSEIADGEIHQAHEWVVADSAARTALSVVAADIGKIAFQSDSAKFYILEDTGPSVWSAVAPSAGETNTMSSLTGDVAIFKQKATADFELRTIVGGTNCTVVEGANDITINNTATPAATIGEDFAYEESRAESSTTLHQSFAKKVTMVTPTLTGTYRVAWGCAVGQSTADATVVCRLSDDGTAIGQDQWFKVNAVTTSRETKGGVYYLVFTAETKTFDLEYKVNSYGPGTAYIEDAFIELWKVS